MEISQDLVPAVLMKGKLHLTAILDAYPAARYVQTPVLRLGPTAVYRIINNSHEQFLLMVSDTSTHALDPAARLGNEHPHFVRCLSFAQLPSSEPGKLAHEEALLECPGEPLSVLAKDASPEEVRVWAHQSLLALIYAQRRGMTGLRFCPDTMFYNEGVVRLACFSAADTPISEDPYAPPDPIAPDSFAWGMCFYQLMARLGVKELRHHSESRKEYDAAFMSLEVLGRLEGNLSSVVAGCLAYSPEERLTLEAAEKLVAKGDPYSDPGVAIDAYRRMGEAYSQYACDYRTALAYFLKSLELAMKLHGEEHVATAAAYADIGQAYSFMGDYRRALEFNSKAAGIRERQLGVEHPETAESYAGIGLAHHRMGEYRKALDLYKKAADIRTKVLGPEDPATAASLTNLAQVYNSLGDYAMALEYGSKAALIRERTLGLGHPDTAASYSVMGSVYRKTGELQKALDYNLKATAIREKQLGAAHSDTALSYSGLGTVYYTMGNYEKALEFYTKAVSVWEKLLGPEHPDTARSYCSLGTVYHRVGNFLQALDQYTKAAAVQEKSLGPEHPDTVASYDKIGSAYNSMGEYEKALDYYLKVVSVSEKVLGLEHPNTGTAYNNIGSTYRKMGRTDKAVEFFGKALRIFRERLGADHRTTRRVEAVIRRLSA